MTFGLVVDDLRVFFVRVPVVGARAVLQFCNCIRCPHVFFTTCSPCVLATRFQTVGQHRAVAKRGLVHAYTFFCYFKNANTFHTA